MNKYSWDAKDYAKHSSAQQNWARELITKLGLQGNENILDIGCGDGKVTVEIAAHVPRGSVLGVDNSSSMIELARSVYSNKKYPNLFFQQVDARALTFDQRFDIVFSNATLHWVRDHQPVLKGIYASLCPGGRILLQMGGKGNAASILSILAKLIKQTAWIKYFEGFEFPYGFYRPKEYKKWLEEVGFRPIRIELIPKDMTHEKRSALAGWIRTTWLPYTERIPEHQRETFNNAIVNRYFLKYPPNSDGIIHVKMVRLEVEAIKSV